MSEIDVTPGDVILGKYRIERVLGAGNMGLVLAAWNIDLEQRVAIKLMLPSRVPEEQHQRFLREARLSARLTSSHVVKVLDVGTTERGAPYMIMEYLAGRDLAAELGARGPLPFSEAVAHVLQACVALAEAHAAGIVHRDLKPANLFLVRGSDGASCVKVLDFGVSKVRGSELTLTGHAEALGTPLYMSPEQMQQARDVDARTDVWALAVSLYELVAGRTAFHSDTIGELCTRVYFKPPTPLATHRADVPPGFEAVVFHALEKDPVRRYPSVAAFAAALVPFGPAGSAVYAERAATLLGEPAVPARPTDVLSLQPAHPATSADSQAAGGTGGPVVRPARIAAPRSRRAQMVVGSAIALSVIVSGVGLFRWRTTSPTVSAASTTATAAPVPVDPAAPSIAPMTSGSVPVVTAAVATEPAPTSAPVVTAAPSGTVAPAPSDSAPQKKPPTEELKPKTRETPKHKKSDSPKPKPTSNLYAE